jgi:hypothetical protein
MEKKYYTPDISEFYVGFECEFKDLSGNFIPIVHTEESISYKDTFRVKYLDKEDIENLGFKRDYVRTKLPENIGFWLKKKYADHMKFYKDDLYATYNTKGKLLFLSNLIYPTNLSISLVIKNKSELKKLLKQLNINYNE